jgi:glycosyltransferase involved in cell wall biosynthesis
MQPLLSIIIPFYNRYDLVKEAIRNILLSDFSYVEILLIDDASTEDGYKYFQECADTSALNFGQYGENAGKLIRYFRLDKNSGPGAARNIGIIEAKGEWLFFHDSDDNIYPDALDKISTFLNKNNTADVILLKQMEYTYPSGLKNIRTLPYVDDHPKFDEIIRTQNPVNPGWNYCFRNAFIKEFNISFPEMRSHEDLCFTFTALCKARKFSVFNDVFYNHSIKCPGGITSDYKENKQAVIDFKNGRICFYNVIKNILDNTIDMNKKNEIHNFLMRCFLFSYYDFKTVPALNLLDYEKQALEHLKTIINWRHNKSFYITPCLLTPEYLINLLEQNSVNFSGFLDNNIDSPQSLLCISSGYSVTRTSDFIKSDNNVIYIFGYYQNEIASRLNSIGLIENKHYIKTGLLF